MLGFYGYFIFYLFEVMSQLTLYCYFDEYCNKVDKDLPLSSSHRQQWEWHSKINNLNSWESSDRSEALKMWIPGSTLCSSSTDENEADQKKNKVNQKTACEATPGLFCYQTMLQAQKSQYFRMKSFIVSNFDKTYSGLSFWSCLI